MTNGPSGTTPRRQGLTKIFVVLLQPRRGGRIKQAPDANCAVQQESARIAKAARPLPCNTWLIMVNGVRRFA